MFIDEIRRLEANRKFFFYFAFVLIAVLYISTIASGYPNHVLNDLGQKFNVEVDGKAVEFNDSLGYPEIKNKRTMVPIRVISEDMGYDVKWNNKDRKVIITNDGNEVILTIGDSFAMVNGVRKPIDRREDGKVIETKSYIKNKRTMVPIRFIAEAFGSKVDYKRDNGVNIITITTGEKPVEKPVEEPKDKYGIKRPNEPAIEGVGEKKGLGSREYKIYPKARTVIFDGPLLIGGIKADKLIGDEPKGWVEPEFKLLSNLPMGKNRGQTMLDITLLNRTEYPKSDMPITTAKATPEIDRLATYSVVGSNGDVMNFSNQKYTNRQSSEVYALMLLNKGEYQDGSPVKPLPFGTIVPTTIEFTYKGYTKTYILPIEITDRSI